MPVVWTSCKNWTVRIVVIDVKTGKNGQLDTATPLTKTIGKGSNHVAVGLVQRR